MKYLASIVYYQIALVAFSSFFSLAGLAAEAVRCQVIQCMLDEAGADHCELILSAFLTPGAAQPQHSSLNDPAQLENCREPGFKKSVESVSERYDACRYSYSFTDSCGQFKNPSAVTGVCHFLVDSTCRNFEVMNVYKATSASTGIAGYCEAGLTDKACRQFVLGLVLP